MTNSQPAQSLQSTPLTPHFTTPQSTTTHSRIKPPHLTKQQCTILTYIFTYRFLTIKHLQSFLGYKDKRYIQTLLNDLLAKHCLHQIYDPKNFKARGIPATYYLATSGVRFIRSLDIYDEPELRKRYADTKRSAAYIDHCLLMADCAVQLQASSNENKIYSWITRTDYNLIEKNKPEAEYLQELQPHLFYTNTSSDKVIQYVVEHIHSRLPHARLRQRLTKLLKYATIEWLGGSPAPSILIICDEVADLLYVKRRVRYLLDDQFWGETVDVRVTTTENARTVGVTHAIWESIFLRKGA